MKVFVLLISVAIMCGGCVLSSKPKEDVGFATVPNLAAFNGCYHNQGEVGVDTHQRYLSAAIWPEQGLEHKSIEAIHVQAVAGNALRVTAITKQQPSRQQTFVAGEDFDFGSGQIKLPSKIHGSGATEPGNVFIGVGHGSTTIGIDPDGNGRIQDTATFAGTAFLIIPVAGHVRDASRHKKSEVLCGGSY